MGTWCSASPSPTHVALRCHCKLSAALSQARLQRRNSLSDRSCPGGQSQRSWTTQANTKEEPSAHVLQSPAYCSVIWKFASTCLLLEAEQKCLGSTAMHTTLRMSADLYLTSQAISLAFRCKSILCYKWKQLKLCFISASWHLHATLW